MMPQLQTNSPSLLKLQVKPNFRHDLWMQQNEDILSQTILKKKKKTEEPITSSNHHEKKKFNSKAGATETRGRPTT
jgi:hypothetical protein